jgi:mono/diheme cytochrome c family protein
MKNAILVAAIVGILLGAIFTTQAQGQDNSKVLYQKNCAACHGNTGKGDGRDAGGLGTRPTDFTDARFWRNDPGKKIGNAIENGHGAMPPVDLTPGEIKAISEYMEKTFKK